MSFFVNQKSSTMKARNLFMALLLLCFSCGAPTISDSEKEKIQKEVKEQIQTTIKSLESADAEALKQTLFNTSDFRYAGSSGTLADYKSSCEFIDGFLGSLINQKGEITNEKIYVLDKSTVLYVAQSKWTMNFKDGRIVVQEPWIWENLLKKVDGKWLSMYGSEFGQEKMLPNIEKQKELNQIELHKQFIGKWQADFGKDTICFMELKPFGLGLTTDFKYITKGKPFIEGKQLIGIDPKTERFTLVEQEKGSGNSLLSVFFVTKSRWLMIPYSYALYPDNSPVRWECEFISPDQINYFEVRNNKAGEIRKFMRIK